MITLQATIHCDYSGGGICDETTTAALEITEEDIDGGFDDYGQISLGKTTKFYFGAPANEDWYRPKLNDKHFCKKHRGY